jgi:hypothetical protein
MIKPKMPLTFHLLKDRHRCRIFTDGSNHGGTGDYKGTFETMKLAYSRKL